MRGCVLYVHPFAEEMNKSRRMAAMQARGLASHGYSVLMVDLFGCGDSGGEMRDATISAWREDLDAAAAWARSQALGPMTVWGLRFGALLAADWAARSGVALERLLFWQPVLNGEIFLTQFLRLGVAADLIASGKASDGSSGLRKRLKAGVALEIGGYDITPKLAEGMGSLKLGELAIEHVPTDWIEVTPAGAQLSPASARIIEQWRARNQCVRARIVEGDPFWATVEITDCPALIEATTQTMDERWWLHSKSMA